MLPVTGAQSVSRTFRWPNGVYLSAVDAARLLLRHAKTHGNLAEAECNGHPWQYMSPPVGCSREAWNVMVNKAQAKHEAQVEKRQAQVERRMREVCAACGLSANFQGDPRGYTVKIAFPDGAYNTMGGREDGWGVPQ